LEIEPFDDKFIYPGKNIFAYKLGKIYVPASIQVLPQSGSMTISPVPHYVRNWQSYMHKKNAMDFAKHSFWEDNKYFIMVIVTAAICLALVGVTIYYTYHFATGGTEKISLLTRAIENINSIPSK